MDILFRVRSETFTGPKVHIHCPACRSQNVLAQAREQVDELLLLHVIPIGKFRNTMVRCSGCGRDLLTKIPATDLTTYGPQQLGEQLSQRVSFVGQFAAIASVLLACVPIVGVLLGVLGMTLTLRTRGWPFVLSCVGIGLGVFLTLVLMLILVMG